MNILIYLPVLNQTSGGTKQYSIALIKTLSQDTLNKYFILNYDENSDIKKIACESNNLFILPKFIAKEYLFEKIGLFFVKFYNIILSVLQFDQSRLNFSFLDRICLFYNIDIIHCPFQYAPYSYSKTIWTLHDVQELHFPQYFTPTKREQRARVWNDSFRRADHVMVSFNHVKSDIKKFFNYDSVSVAFIDLKYLWISDYIQKFGRYSDVDSNYLIYAANTWEHKNHIGLVRAIKLIRDKYQKDIFIVFVGHKTLYYNNIIEEISNLEVDNLITFTDVLSDEELFSMYKNARLSVIPTIYEAGSFPLIESLLLGIPTLCSSVTSLPETIGSDSFVFDPNDVEQMADLIYSAFISGSFRSNCMKNSLNQGEVLQKIENAPIYRELYSRVLNNE